MTDISKQVAYWRDGAEEELAVAHDLLDKRRPRQCLFFAHLALEKLVKAFVCQKTQAVAPRIHNLVRLAQLAVLPLTQEQIDVLADANEFCVEGRYPDQLPAPPTVEEARRQLGRVEEFFQWLLPRL